MWPSAAPWKDTSRLSPLLSPLSNQGQAVFGNTFFSHRNFSLGPVCFPVNIQRQSYMSMAFLQGSSSPVERKDGGERVWSHNPFLQSSILSNHLWWLSIVPAWFGPDTLPGAVRERRKIRHTCTCTEKLGWVGPCSLWWNGTNCSCNTEPQHVSYV